MNTKKQTLENEEKKLTNEFDKLFAQLVEKKEFELAKGFSEIYYKTKTNQFSQGTEFIKNLYQL